MHLMESSTFGLGKVFKYTRFSESAIAPVISFVWLIFENINFHLFGPIHVIVFDH